MYFVLGQTQLDLAPYLTTAFGIIPLGLTVYTSTLSYVLLGYSRSRLSERLGGENDPGWLTWLDAHETDLQVSLSFTRVVSNLLVLVWVGSCFISSTDPQFAPATVIATVVITLLLLLLFGIGIPHALALHSGEVLLARSLGFLVGLRLVLWPIARALQAVEFIVRRLLGKSDTADEKEATRMEQDILEAVSEGKAHGAVDEEQEDMIESVFELHNTAVSAIMTPRTDMVAIPADAPYDQVREVILKAGHSRIPVQEESIDHIVGVLYAKDLIHLKSDEPFDIRAIMRPARYVPETKNIDHLLRELRQNRVHIAIVLDEYGGTAGLVTIEDIIEELVGEIDDEYDPSAPPPINRVDEDTLEVDARVHVEDINEELDVHLPEDADYDTIGGFVFTTLGKIPVTGEEFTHENLHFHIMDAEERKINRMRIHVARAAQTA
ncbi:MAG: hemolysin family protein [Planctomycetes bacterium]|nr:hemolysin family protein [Planctomycetota bacterium]